MTGFGRGGPHSQRRESWHGICLRIDCNWPVGPKDHKEVSLKVLYLLALMLVAFAASACNTTRGLGQDVEATGDAIEDEADETMDDDDDN